MWNIKTDFCTVFFKISNYLLESGGSHSGTSGDTCLVECDTVFLGSYLAIFPSHSQRSLSPIRFGYLTQKKREWHSVERSLTVDNETSDVPEDMNAVITCRLSLIQRINNRILEKNGVGKGRSTLESCYLFWTNFLITKWNFIYITFKVISIFRKSEQLHCYINVTISLCLLSYRK